MPIKAIFTVELDPALHDAFVAATEADDRPASQVVQDFMRGYIERRQSDDERTEFLRRKVEQARKSAEIGRGRSHKDVEADFITRRDAASA